MSGKLQVRWLGRVGYREALDVQRRLWSHSADDYLLLLEHNHVFTAGPSADEANLLVDPGEFGADCVRIDRGGDFTYHGLSWFDRIIPCGIRDFRPTSLRAEGSTATLREVADAVVLRATQRWSQAGCERADVAWRHRPSDLSAFSRQLGPGRVEVAPPRSRARLAEAGVEDGLRLAERKPPWLRARMDLNEGYLRLRRVMRQHDLVTVCEEAGCPNIFECWGAGTATFMLNGERCTRACGFCLVDTRQPMPIDPGEPARVADAVAEMDLDHAVVTAVARDDLSDGGAAAFAETIAAIRSRSPGTTVEVLVPDFGGDAASLHTVLEAGPDVLNHNIETIARLQRAVRPSAGYARSLALLARSASAGHVTKSGIIVGMGEDDAEVDVVLADLAAVGASIVTIGQYLRPTSHHIPVARWVSPESFERWRDVGATLGIDHVESSPLTRSSYHAAESAAAVELGARTRPVPA